MPNDNIVQKNKIGIKGFAGRVQQAARENPSELMASATCKNRIVLLLDNSSSMTGMDGAPKSKINLLKDAVQGFVNACDTSDTALALYAIPTEPSTTVPMTQQTPLIILGSLHLDASGGTPLGASMRTALESEAMTRCLIVSDGEATDGERYKEVTDHYREAQIPCDCLHIGSSVAGEDTLKYIANKTDGMFIKFKDVSQFAKSIHYLTPRYAAMLSSASESEIAQITGANEVKKR